MTGAGRGAAELPQLELLRARAGAAMEQAYAPYSGFRVGAALLAADGSVDVGCNVENAASPSGICAERAAVAGAMVRGARAFTAIVIVTEADSPTSPCGMCRQVLMELAPELVVYSMTRGGASARWLMSDLLPEAFTPTSLGRR
ncbi:MAG: cytidine deaminase [Gemmatimonadetes bacterium]|jgi:cytidine deaminase|nr:cytidine deaminase [Gemmatimonadota bacterium]